MRHASPLNMAITAVVWSLGVGAAGGQPNDHGFVPGHVFFGEHELESCPSGADGRRFVRELDPVTGDSWRILSADDGLCFPNGFAFTPNGRKLRIVDGGANRILDLGPAGDVSSAYFAADGLDGPTGPAFGANGDFCIANFYRRNILRFPSDRGPAIVIADAQDGVGGTPSPAFAPSGELFFDDSACCIRQLHADGSATVFDNLGAGKTIGSTAFDRNGNLFACAHDGNAGYVFRYDDGIAANRALLATLPFARGVITVDWASGFVVWLDALRVARIDPASGEAEVLFEFPQGPDEYTFGSGSAVVFNPPETGDMNCDGRFNFFDIEAFIAALKGPDAYDAAYGFCDRALADLNGDGTVNPFDIQSFVELLDGP